MKNLLLMTIALIACCLISCAGPVPISLDEFQKGRSVESILENSYKPKKRFQVTLPNPSNTQVDVLVYDIYMGRIANDYFVAFENNKLFFWGYPNEFTRSNDPYINQVGAAAIAEFMKIK